MAEETKKTAAATEEVVVADVPVAEEPKTDAVEKEVLPQPEPEKVEELAAEAEKEEKDEGCEENKVAESASFKEESNKVDDLIDPEKKALDEFKLLIQEALNNHEFTAPPPPPPLKEEEEAKCEEKKEEEPKPEEKTEETPAEVPAAEPVKDDAAEATDTPTPAAEPSETVDKAAEESKDTIVHEVTTPAPPPPAAAAEEEAVPPPPVEPVKDAAALPTETPTETAAVDKADEEIKDTIVHEVPAAAAPCEEEAAPPPPPEEVSIWGIPLLSDERSDVILLKFLRARDFKVKEALAMLKSVVAWRKEFKIDELLVEEGLGEGLEKVGFIHGVDKEGHPVSYNAFGEFQDKELYSNTFSDAEKRGKFLRWYIQFLEKNIRKLDFSPEGISTIVQVTDLKNSPGLILFKKELRQATNQALQLLQDNYPEFVAKQVFINVPWWYVAYNRMISPFLTQRTKSKFVFAGPTKTAETLLKYIAPEQVPVQYGGLSKEGEQEFTTSDAAIEETIKPACKHTIELPISEAGTLVWEVRVTGWDVSYGAEFVPSAEGGYTWIVQKSRKIGPADEQVLSCSFKIGEPGKVVLTFDNQSSKKKKLLYRSKANKSSE